MPRLPSIRGLEAFAAVARVKSIAAAAAPLGLSIPALSRRVTQLEAEVGQRLFERLPRGVELTPAGAAYLARVLPALELLRPELAESAGPAAPRRVHVTTIPAFANRWLLPRLHRFHADHPQIEVVVGTSTEFEPAGAGRFDLAVRLARNDSMAHPPLLPITLFPVWRAGHLTITTPADFARHVLLTPDHRPEFWIEWLKAFDLDPLAYRLEPTDSSLYYEAAASGGGVAIGLHLLVEPLLSQKRLQGLRDHAIGSTRGLHLVALAYDLSPAARTFRNWLTEESRRFTGGEPCHPRLNAARPAAPAPNG